MLMKRKRWVTPTANSSGGATESVHEDVCWSGWTIPPSHVHVIGDRVKPAAGLQHQQRAIQAGRELLEVVQVGVVDEIWHR
jgi:hypothetical protein